MPKFKTHRLKMYFNQDITAWYIECIETDQIKFLWNGLVILLSCVYLRESHFLKITCIGAEFLSIEFQ